MKKLLKLLCVIEGITILPFQSFAKTKEKEEDIHYDNYYTDYVYNNYLKNKKKTTYDIETIQTEETIYEVPIYSSTTTTVINKNIIQNNEINKTNTPTTSSIKQNENDTEYDFYIGFGVGISKFENYEVKQAQYSTDKATMKPDRDSNVYFNFGINNLIKDSMNLEFEIGYVENDKISTPNENGVYLIDYNQKIKTYNVGANLIYDIVDVSSLFTPYVGFGVGMARFELSDFGIVKENDILTNFESKSETKDTIYGKITAGIMYSMSNSSKFTVGAEYIKYKDIDYKYLSLSGLERINFTAGLRFYF